MENLLRKEKKDYWLFNLDLQGLIVGAQIFAKDKISEG